jgi:hypothetical protein
LDETRLADPCFAGDERDGRLRGAPDQAAQAVEFLCATDHDRRESGAPHEHCLIVRSVRPSVGRDWLAGSTCDDEFTSFIVGSSVAFGDQHSDEFVSNGHVSIVRPDTGGAHRLKYVSCHATSAYVSRRLIYA